MSLQGPDQNSEPTNCIWPTSICAETSRHLYCVDSVKIVYSLFILDSGRFGCQQNVYHDLTLASTVVPHALQCLLVRQCSGHWPL